MSGSTNTADEKDKSSSTEVVPYTAADAKGARVSEAQQTILDERPALLSVLLKADITKKVRVLVDGKPLLLEGKAVFQEVKLSPIEKLPVPLLEYVFTFLSDKRVVPASSIPLALAPPTDYDNTFRVSPEWRRLSQDRRLLQKGRCFNHFEFRHRYTLARDTWRFAPGQEEKGMLNFFKRLGNYRQSTFWPGKGEPTLEKLVQFYQHVTDTLLPPYIPNRFFEVKPLL